VIGPPGEVRMDRVVAIFARLAAGWHSEGGRLFQDGLGVSEWNEAFETVSGWIRLIREDRVVYVVAHVV
jgi:hypothetical protein